MDKLEEVKIAENQLREQLKQAQEEIEGLKDALNEALPRVKDWSEAYPTEAFPAPNWNKVRELLGDALLTEVSAANMRHVATRMWAILKPVTEALYQSMKDEGKHR